MWYPAKASPDNAGLLFADHCALLCPALSATGGAGQRGPPGDLLLQITIAARQSPDISFGNPENVNIFGREGQDPPLRFLSINSSQNRNLTLNSQLSILNYQLSILNSPFSILNLHRLPLHCGHMSALYGYLPTTQNIPLGGMQKTTGKPPKCR